jgi:hypothetical protein
LCCAVNGGNFILLLHEGASVERLHLVCDADDAFSLRHDLSSKKRPCLAWPSATVGCKDLEYRAPKVVNFSPQPHNSLSFYWNVDDRHILLQRLIGGSIGVFELDAILTGRAWIRIEKCITNIAEGKIFRPWRRSVAWLWQPHSNRSMIRLMPRPRQVVAYLRTSRPRRRAPLRPLTCVAARGLRQVRDLHQPQTEPTASNDRLLLAECAQAFCQTPVSPPFQLRADAADYQHDA